MYNGDNLLSGLDSPLNLDELLKNLLEANSPPDQDQIRDAEFSNTGLCSSSPPDPQPAANEVRTDNDDKKKQFATLQSVQQQSEPSSCSNPTSESFMGQPNELKENLRIMYEGDSEPVVTDSSKQVIDVPDVSQGGILTSSGEISSSSTCVINTTAKKAKGRKKKGTKMYERPDKDNPKVQRSIKQKAYREKAKTEKEEREQKICILEENCSCLQGELDACRQTIKIQNEEISLLNDTITTLQNEKGKLAGEVEEMKLKVCRDTLDNNTTSTTKSIMATSAISAQQQEELEIIIRPCAQKRKLDNHNEGEDEAPSAFKAALTFRAKLVLNETDVDL